MLKLNLRSGKTLSFDLCEPAGLAEWQRRQSEAAFQREITGAGIQTGGVLHVIPLPRRFARARYWAEPVRSGGQVIGERLGCHADAVEVRLSVLFPGERPGAVRVELERIGTPRWLRPELGPQVPMER